jgi:ribulose-phosphate 3-epimerase
MCLPMDNLGQSINELEKSGIDRFHLDVMDGVFVPNYSLGIQDIETICRLSCKKTELHMMTINPGRYIRKFADLGIDIIYIHPESDYHPSAVIQLIAETGAKPGIVLSPGTSVDSVKDLLQISEYVLVMSVNPGQAGQSFLPHVGEKILQLVNLKEECGFELGLDGGCSPALIARYFPLGVDSFVLGHAGLFHGRETYIEAVQRLRSITRDGLVDKQPLGTIKLLATDVDGTLTDGRIYMGADGEMMKAFDVKDGYAIRELLPKHGVTPVIITGRQSRIVENRARELGVELLFQGVADKLALVKKIAEERGLGLDEIAYIGDDINDLDCVRACGLGACPADAADAVKKHADYVSGKPGGAGAVRDFAEWVIRKKSGVPK